MVEGAARDLHPIIRDEVYRIACEALRNAFNHARANIVEAEITYGDGLFRLRIRDDGEGIPTHILESGTRRTLRPERNAGTRTADRRQSW